MIDTKPRTLTNSEQNILRIFSNSIISLLELRKKQLRHERTNRAMKLAIDSYARIDLDSNYTYLSESYASKLGYTPDELLRKPCFSVLHESEATKVQQLKEQLKYTTKVEFETILVCKDGSPKHIQVTLVADYDDEYNVSGYFSFTQDISRRKAMELELQETQALQELVFNNNPDYIVVKDKDCKIVLANKAFFGAYPKEQHNKIIGHTTFESFDKQDAEDILAKDRQAFEEGYSETYERILLPNGKVQVFFTKKIRFENSKKEPFILGIARDVTEKEDLIRQLKQSNNDLDEFSYIASHDLKEPLRGIQNHLQMIQRKELDTLSDDGNRRINRVLEITKHAQALITDLFHFSRLGSEENAWQDTNLNILLAEIISSTPTVEEYNVNVIIKNVLPTVFCDKVRMGEVFRNLIVNAIKYNNSPHKTIEIGTATVHEHRKEHVVFVKDNGIGIDPKFHTDIFRIFKRLDKRSADTAGTGAGLTFVKKIIDRHKGSIWIDSAEGKGTTFFFALPKHTQQK